MDLKPGFHKLLCSVCQRVTWHYKEHNDHPPKCGSHSQWTGRKHPVVKDTIGNLGSFREESHYHVPHVRGSVTERKLRDGEKRSPHRLNIPSDHTLCAGCGKLTPLSFARSGKIWTDVRFITKVIDRLVWDSKTKKLIREQEEKTIPIQGYRKGMICSDCAANPGTFERVNRRGETEKEPVVLLDPLPSYNQTLPSERVPNLKPEPKREKVNWRNPASGSGKLIWDPATRRTYQEKIEEIDPSSYRAFTKGK